MAYRLVFHYFPGDSRLHRWDTRCKFIGLALATFGLLHMEAKALVLFSLLLAVGVASSHLPLRAVVHDLKAWALFLLFIFVVQALSFSEPQETLAPWFPVSNAGCQAAALTCWRLGLILGYGVLFTFVTRPRDLQDALIWFLKPFPFLPAQRIALMVTLTLRLIPLIMDQLEEVSLASKSRLGNRRKSLLHRAKFLVLPLFQRSFIRTDELALALAARGYREDRTVHLQPIPLAHVLVLILVGLSVAACSPLASHLMAMSADFLFP
jgi:biotin transport system permease protein